jgi:hypothetical protein
MREEELDADAPALQWLFLPGRDTAADDREQTDAENAEGELEPSSDPGVGQEEDVTGDKQQEQDGEENDNVVLRDEKDTEGGEEEPPRKTAPIMSVTATALGSEKPCRGASAARNTLRQQQQKEPHGGVPDNELGALLERSSANLHCIQAMTVASSASFLPDHFGLSLCNLLGAPSAQVHRREAKEEREERGN